MKKLMLIFLVVVVMLPVCSEAKTDDDILLDMIPAICTKCKYSYFAQQAAFWALVAEVTAQESDRNQVLNFVSKYPEGGQPPVITVDAQGNSNITIPSRAAAFYVLGAQAVTKGNKLVAAWCFAEALSRNPRCPMFLNNAGFAFIEYGFFTLARQMLECAKTLAPDFVSVYVNLGAAYYCEGNYKAAADNYRKAFEMFPTNANYCRLAANAYAKEGDKADAWDMANIGLGSFPNAYDWQTFITSLNYTPNPTECGIVDYNDPYASFMLRILDMSLWGEEVSNYIQNVMDPALDQAAATEDACFPTNVSCAYKDSCKETRCEASADIKRNQCDLSYQFTVWDIQKKENVASLGFWLSKCEKDTVALQDLKNQLTAQEFSNLECRIQYQKEMGYSNFYNSTEATAEDAMAEIESDEEAIANDLNSVQTFCYGSSNPFAGWLITGQWSGAVAPKFCLAVLCGSYNPISGLVTVSIEAGGAVQLTYDPLQNEIVGLNLGAGFTFGLGPFDVDASIYLTLTPEKAGYVAEASLYGMPQLQYFYGYEHLGPATNAVAF